MLQSLSTHYAGYCFRSRLEARWAVFLDHLGVRWEYEPEGFRLSNGLLYLPDFWLPQVKMWAEVKPNDEVGRLVLTPEAQAKAVGLALGSVRPVLFLDGPPRDTNYWAIWPEEFDNPLGWYWCDVWLTYPRAYHQAEGRFYASTGRTFPDHLPEDEGLWGIHPAVAAARSARFEHGRQG